MFSSIGPLEIGIVLLIALVVFGPKRLPELGSSLGKGIRGFGQGIKGEGDDEEEQRPEPAALTGTAAAAPASEAGVREGAPL